MNILSVAFPFASVSLDSAGGAEQILALLDRGLAARGHRSVVIAAEGSTVDGELIAINAAGSQAEVHTRWRNAISEAVQTHRPHLIHFHGLDFHSYLPAAGTRALVTLHLPPSFYPEEVFRLARPQTWLNCVSQSQLRDCPPSSLHTGVIENGVPLELLNGPPDRSGGYAFAMGRICPEKGFHLAVDAADKAHVPLYLAGKLFPYPDHVRYWREELSPRLRAPHRFLGPVTLCDKPRLMSMARCVLVPSLVAETSSLVAMESLACGTPVIAFKRGALPELIEDGRTGFLVEDSQEMAQAIGRTESLDRSECQAMARVRFCAGRMVDQYLALYANLLARQS